VSAVSISVAEWDDPDVTALHGLQRIDIDGRYGGDTEPGTKPSKADISVVLLARDESGRPVGTGALRQLDENAAELKRMYTVDDVRGAGVGRALLAALEEQARQRGWTVLRLETGPLQHEAIGLYTSSGYQPIPPFGQYVGAPQSLCFERVLDR
jgi:GNAT superfamily N-acetyltransferase